MARAVFTIVGTVVGAYFGGAAGGQLGASIGGAIGGYIGGAIGQTFEPTQRLAGPRLDDLRVIQSAYGGMIPRIYGNENRVSGMVIWSTDLIEHENVKDNGDGKGGGGGSETTTYTYSVSLAVALAEGVCHNIRRIWANGKLLWSWDSINAAVSAAQTKATEAQARADMLRTWIDTGTAPPEIGYDLLPPTEAEWQQAQDAADALTAAVTAMQANQTIVANGGADWSLTPGTGLNTGGSTAAFSASGGNTSNVSYLAFYRGTGTQLPDPEIQADKGIANTSGYRHRCYVVIGGLQLADYGNAVPNLEFELQGNQVATVGQICQNVCEDAGLVQGEFSVGSAPLDGVRGFSISNAGSAYGAIQSLQSIYNFDILERVGQIHFLKRGRHIVTTLDVEEMGARQLDDTSGKAFELTRIPDFDLDDKVAVTFRNPALDYEEDTQNAVRQGGTSRNNKSVSAAIVLTADEGRDIAGRLLWEAWTARRNMSFSVSDKYRFLSAGDVFASILANSYLPFRITSRSRGANGMLQLDTVQDDPFINGIDLPGGGTSIRDKTLASVGDTFLYVFNSPILMTTDSDTAFTWVADAASSGWRSGATYRSQDGGISFAAIGTIGVRNTTGTVSAALASGPTDIFDNIHTLDVVLRYSTATLDSVTEDEVLMGKNAFWLGDPDGSHGEIIQFTTATLLSSNPKTYRLSGLLRGRRATEHETSLHGTNEVFVLLERLLLHVHDFGAPDWYLTTEYKGVSTYQSPLDVITVQYFQNLGERAMCRSPVNGTGTRDGSNNLTIGWTRRCRGLPPTLGTGSVPMEEETEAYEIDVMSGSTVKRTLTATSQSASYTAAQQTTDGFTPGNPINIRVYQISATRGRGHAGVFTI